MQSTVSSPSLAITSGGPLTLIGARDGCFPDIGHRLPGEMGGLWHGQIKVCDGFFFAIDDEPLRVCDAFTQDALEARFTYALPARGLTVTRTQSIPDGIAGVVVALTVANHQSAPRMVEVSFTVRTELIPGVLLPGTEDGADTAEYDARIRAYVARDARNPWFAAWGAGEADTVLLEDQTPEVFGFGNTAGRGVNGRMFYRMRLPAGGENTMHFYITGIAHARSQVEDLLEALRTQAQSALDEKRARLAAQANAPAVDCADWRAAREAYALLLRTDEADRPALLHALPESPLQHADGQALFGLLPLGGAQTLQALLSPRPAGTALDGTLYETLCWLTFMWTGDIAWLHAQLRACAGDAPCAAMRLALGAPAGPAWLQAREAVCAQLDTQPCDAQAALSAPAAGRVVWQTAIRGFGIWPQACTKTLVLSPDFNVPCVDTVANLPIGTARFTLRRDAAARTLTVSASEPGWRVVLGDGAIQLAGEMTVTLA